MGTRVIDRDGECPRCQSLDIERSVILQTTAHLVSGVVFRCETCGLRRSALSSDREGWWNVHRAFKSPHMTEATWEEFSERWPKKVARPTYGEAEPLGPILPVPKPEALAAIQGPHGPEKKA